jgi:hypothetical protein
MCHPYHSPLYLTCLSHPTLGADGKEGQGPRSRRRHHPLSLLRRQPILPEVLYQGPPHTSSTSPRCRDTPRQAPKLDAIEITQPSSKKKKKGKELGEGLLRRKHKKDEVAFGGKTVSRSSRKGLRKRRKGGGEAL